MPRPIKWRRVESIPDEKYFVPFGHPRCKLTENILKIEELEALRLKDIELLDQDECAARMQISRQTFQRILAEAHLKVADALVNEKAIRICGGNYTINVCTLKCLNCGHEWTAKFEDLEQQGKIQLVCPECNTTEIICIKNGRKHYCQKLCCRHRQKKVTTSPSKE